MRNQFTPQFASPNNGPGRPPLETDIPFEIDKFVNGVDFYNDPMSAPGSCYFAINNRCTSGRTLDKRNGYTQLGSTAGDGKVLMIGTLKKFGALDLLLRIVPTATQVKLQKYDTTLLIPDWVDIGAPFGNMASQIDFFWASTVIGTQERFYFTNGIDTLRYTEGTTITTVLNDGVPIVCSSVTSVENILGIGGMRSVFSPSVFMYSKANTDQFRRDTDLVFADSKQTVRMDDEIIRVASLGWLMYLFTPSEGTWEIDLKSAVPRQISTHGTMSPKSVATGFDAMIWCDQYGIWGLALGGEVQRLSEPIDNLYKTLSFADLQKFNAIITPDGLYKLWIGSISVEGITYGNCCLVYDIERSRLTGQKIWRIDTNIKANCWTIWTNQNNFKSAYFGSNLTTKSYIDDSGNMDDGEYILMEYWIPDRVLANKKEQVQLKEVYLEIQPNSTYEMYYDLYARGDMGTWTLIKNNFAVPFDVRNRLAYVKISPTTNIIGRTLGLRLVNQSDLPLRIYEIYPTVSKMASDIPLS